jgi:mannitol/fructose-specific phosphotransferase system IIA component (Ntr-type)
LKFIDFISRSSICTQLPPVDKPELVRHLVQALADANDIHPEDIDALVAAILAREAKGSTGLGRGVAIPHALCDVVTRQVGTVGVCPGGTDFDALDGDKSDLFILLLSPADQQHAHLETLKHIALQLRNDTFCRFLKQSPTPADVWEVLEESDHEHALL